MASIIKRKKSYSVVYNFTDENGETRQKWETWHTHKEALKRKVEIENQINTGTFLPPNNQDISDFMYDFVSLYGEKKWGVSMYDGCCGLIANYINPIIGDLEVQSITPRVVDKYIQTLQKTPSVSTKTRKASTVYVTNQTIEKIIKLLRCAFHQAVRWELIGKNPFEHTVLPKTEYKKRDIWDADTIRVALDQCTKATQGDTGHAEIDMITKVYAHILDADRKINAQKFESAFYSNPDLRSIHPPKEQTEQPVLDLAALIEQLQKSPELANTLAALIAGQK